MHQTDSRMQGGQGGHSRDHCIEPIVVLATVILLKT